MTDNELIYLDDSELERFALPTEHGDDIVIRSDGVVLAETRCCCSDPLTITSELYPEQMIRIAQKLLEWGYRRMYTQEEKN